MPREKHIITVHDGYNDRDMTLELPADIDGLEMVKEFAVIMLWLTWQQVSVEESFAQWLEEKGWTVKKKEEEE